MSAAASSNEESVGFLAQGPTEGVPDCVVFPNEATPSIRFAVLGIAIVAGVLAASVAQIFAVGADLVPYLFFAISFFGGLLSTWSPCGYSSLCLLRPVGPYSGRAVAQYSPTILLHGLGYLAGALILGTVLGVLGSQLGFSDLSSTALLFLGVAGLLYGAHQLGFVRVPYPQRKAQVPHDARQRFPMWVIGGLYGFALGLNYLTYVQTPILYIVTGAAALSGNVSFAVALFLIFNAGRFLPMLVNYLPIRDFDVQNWLVRRQESAAMVDGALLAAAGAALLALAAF